MIKLLAHSPVDGWAIIDRDGVTMLIRPPLNKERSLIKVSPAILKDVSLQPGFEIYCEDAIRTFDDLAELVEFLEDSIKSSRDRIGSPLPATGAGLAILEVAPEEELFRLLGRVKSELIDRGHFEIAERMLFEWMQSPSVTSNLKILHKTAALLSEVHRGRESRENLFNGRLDLSENFPLAAAAYGGPDGLATFTRKVSYAGALLSFEDA